MCHKCNKEVSEDAIFCPHCGEKIIIVKKKTIKKKNYDNVRIFNILSYIGPLWLIGLFCKEKEDKTVKFHVGQGMLITIIAVIGSIINSILVTILKMIFITEINLFGYGTGQFITANWIGGLASLISFLISAVVITLSIIGIINASKDEEKQLPYIGKYSFYK